MDERDVVISKVRQELENSEKQLEESKEIIKDAQDQMLAMRQQVEKYVNLYCEMRDRYTKLMGGIVELIEKLKGD